MTAGETRDLLPGETVRFRKRGEKAATEGMLPGLRL